MKDLKIRPGPALALLFSLGIVLASPASPVGLPAPHPPLLRWLAGALIAALALPIGRRGCRPAIAALLAVDLGALRAASPGDHAGGPDLPAGPVRVEAWVAEVPAVAGRSHGDRAGGLGGPRTLFATRDPDLMVTIQGAAPWISPGERLSMAGRLLPPRRAMNPGDPDRRGSPPILAVESPRSVRTVEFRPLRRPVADLVLGLRDRAQGIIGELYPEETRGFLIAMLLGDRRLLPDGARQAMARTGTIHFLAISGLNVGMAMALVIRLPLPRRTRLPARLLFLVAFTLVTGGAPPVVRAAVMLSIHCAAEAFGRTPRPLDVLSWSALAILAVEPSWAFDIGFQLSVAAVFAMIVWAPAVADPDRGGPASILARRIRRDAAERKGRGKWPDRALRAAAASGRAFRRSLLISLATSAGTAPLILLRFFRVHPLGPLWNLVAAPLVNAILLGGAASIALGVVHPALGIPAARLTDLLSRVLLAILGALARVPGSCLYLPPPPAWSVAAAQALLALGAVPSLRRPALLGLLVLGLGLGAAALAPREPDLLILSVGGGSCSILSVPGGGSCLFDCGAGGRGRGAGERIARAALASGLRRIDGAVLSHAHADHVGGVLELADTIPLGRVWVPPRFGGTLPGRRLLDGLDARGVPVERLARGRRIVLAPGWTLDILHPREVDPGFRPLELNDDSLVVLVRSGEGAVLIPGDIEEKGTARLLAEPDDLSCDLAIIPHHGRRGLLLPELIRRARPETAVIGGDGAGGAEEEREMLRRQGIDVLATWEVGAVRAVLRDGRWQVVGTGP